MQNPPTNLAGYDPTADSRDCWWDPAEAQRVLDFFPRHLKHPTGALVGEPLEPNPWERDFLATVFGWKRPDSTRRYRECFVGIPRKNNKTTCGAGLGLFSTLCEKTATGKFDRGVQTYCAAADKDQASHVFRAAAYMVAEDRTLSQMCKVLDAYRKIEFQELGNFLRAIPAEARRQHGYNANTVIVDELHTQPNRNLYDVLRTSQASRVQPLTISITTAGHDEDSICYELWDYSRKVRDGEVDDPYFLPIIYEATKDDEWTDEEVWRAVNPNYGLSVQPSYIREAFKRALALPAAENTFKNLHLNMWTEAEDRWIGSTDWDACKGGFPDLRGKECVVGLDLGATNDLTALVYVFPLDGKFYVKCHFYCPEETAKNCPKKYQNQYRDWIARGWITTTPGTVTDYGFVRQQIKEDSSRYHIKMILFDQWQAIDTQNQLTDAGFNCVKVAQSFGLLAPGVKAAEEAVFARDLVHDGNECMRWMVASTILSHDANGNRKPNKMKSHGEHGTKGKIDGVVALVMAMSQWQNAQDTSPYNERGLLTV